MNYVLLSLFTLGLKESSCDQVKSCFLVMVVVGVVGMGGGGQEGYKQF